MARGKAAAIGDERVSQNGYHYTRVKEGWELTHRLIAEEKLLFRKLRPDERVSFKNGNKRDLRPENLKIGIQKTTTESLQSKAATLEAKIEELQAQLDEIQEQIKAEAQSTN